MTGEPVMFTFRETAGPGQRFGPDAFTAQIGADVTFTAGADEAAARKLGTAQMIAAEVEPGGRGVSLTFQIDPGSNPDAGHLITALAAGRLPGTSMSLQPPDSELPAGRLHTSIPPVRAARDAAAHAQPVRDT